jgi:tRNA threonylcarbamoyladenosine biosynthesis protein TsaB
MILLAIDTCGSSGSVALARFEGKKFTRLGQTELAGKTYSAQLMPSIRNLLADRKVTLSEIGAIGVTSGPGSFTGIRIGLATAKGLAEVHSIPIIAVSRLAVVAHKAGRREVQIQASALDASRHEFYFRDASGAKTTETLLPRDAFLARAAELGPQLAVCEASVHALAPSAALVEPPTAEDAIRFALPRLAAGEFDDPLTLDGNYIRRSDAEIFSQPGAPPRPRRDSKASERHP